MKYPLKLCNILRLVHRRQFRRLCTIAFMGSGTVAAVAARLGRNYCGSELSSDYLNNQAVLRIAEAETGISMAEQESGQGALFQ